MSIGFSNTCLKEKNCCSTVSNMSFLTCLFRMKDEVNNSAHKMRTR